MKSIGLALVVILLGTMARGEETKSEPSRTVTVKGQVVCSACWSEADRTKVAYGTKDDLECAKTCAASGVKAALAVGEKARVELYILEDGTFPRKGTGWLSYIAKTVEITGRVTGAAGSRHIKVDSLRSLPEGAR